MVDDNVKVAVRVRPLLPKEKVSGEQKCVKVLKDSKQVLVGKDRFFTFDYVISPLEKQDAVYEKCIDDLVSSCLEGFNATVFAYGQTGSGKTYTIGGTSAATHTDDEMGVIPRSLQKLFHLIEGGRKEGVEFQVSASYLELYLEDLRDLLDVSTNSKDITIREDEQGNTVVSGMRAVPCKTIDEVLYCLHHGSAARQTGSTQMNEHSSRSHSVFTVTLEQQWRANEIDDGADEAPEQYHYVCSKFHFVDLAGSERAHRTGNVGDRFKESITINTGLLALGNVISALGDPKKKSSHIPYRDSKITRLLKDSLGGNSKTLMICCISPASSDFDETLNALKYANRARNIRNKPVVNRDIQSINMEEMQNEIQALRRELEIKDSMLREDTSLSARTAMESQMAITMQDRDDRIISLQRTCDNYLHLLNVAAENMSRIESKEILKTSIKSSIQEWMNHWHKLKMSTVLPAIGEDNATISQLKQEIAKYTEMLKNDEDIFAEKSKLISELKKENSQMISKCRGMDSEFEEISRRCQQLEEVLLQQQLAIDKISAQGDGLHDSAGSGHFVTSRRAKSVPLHGDRLGEPLERPVHTSPALFTLERYLQGFRARSQLLVERLDDEDEVLHQPFPVANAEAAADLGEDNFTGLCNTNLAKEVAPSKSRKRTLSFGQVMIRQASEDDNEYGEPTEVKLSMDKHQKEIRQAKLKSQEFNSRLRDLTILIRMKEQLIRQLVKNEKDSAIIAKQHKDKIAQMEEEKVKTNRELQDLQKELQRLEAKEKMEIGSKRKLQGEYKRKIDSAKRRLTNIQTKQKETVTLATMSERNDEKISDLNLAVAKMRQQQEELQKKLKQEHDKKEKLEKEMTKERHKVRELEDKTEQQQKILKIKTEEVAAANRKLRRGNGSSSVLGDKEFDDPKLAEQKQWLDAEMDKILEQRKQMEILDKELRNRAMIICRKEEMLKEKDELELKHLRSSQQFSKTAVTDLEALHKEKKQVQDERVLLDRKLDNAGLLAPEEERRLLELSEAIEALDAAIEFKSELIAGKEAQIRRSQVLSQHEDNLTNRLKSLNISEAQKLLGKYFNKVIELREASHETRLHSQDLQLQLEEQNKRAAELEASLESQARELDTRLTEQQQQYESEISSLLQKISEKESSADTNTHQQMKIQQLEKDLYYYKKTSRDLKKKLREVMLRVSEQSGHAMSADTHVEETEIDMLDQDHHSRPSPRHSPTGTHLPPLAGAMSPAVRASYSSIDGQHVKISKKDLRPMSHEEIIRRSHLYSAHSTRTSADSLDGGM
ncbi:KIF27 [Bugula neritina]|uniref:KIF27 n=1 Tax=Bugula neritina TaxID=10212 RepID=A0A7J7JZW3_BUGNE|nr:KIF27 [Bugula neritina]